MAEGYIIENVVGNAGTRYHRYKSPVTQRCKQFIAGMRVLPGGKVPLTEEAFRREVAKIKQMVLSGTVVIYTPERMKITSTHTGQFILVRADGATKMLPPGEEPECFWAEAAPAPAPVVEAAPEPAPAPEPVFTSAEPTPVTEQPGPYDVEPTAEPVEEPKTRFGKKRR